MIRKRGCGRTEISRGTQDSISGMEKWLSKIVEVGPNKTRVGSGVYPSTSISLSMALPSHHHSVSSHLLAKSLVPAGTSQDLPRPSPHPSCQPACRQDCRLKLETQVVVGEAADLFAPEPAEKSQQSMANNTAGGCSIDLPKALPGLAAGWQVGRWREAGAGLAPGPV